MRNFSQTIYDFLRSIEGVKAGDCDAYFAGKTDLSGVLSKEELKTLKLLEEAVGVKIIK